MNRHPTFYQPYGPGPYSQPIPQAQMPPTIPRKRQLPGSEILTPSFPAIQPKPPGLSPAPYTPIQAESSGPFRPSPGDSAGEPAKKRRGRPSNAQIEKEKAAAAAEGREWQPRPPRPPRKKKSTASKESPPEGEAGPSQTIIPHTPEIQMREAEEEGSSGKARRRKMREEPTTMRATPYDPIRQSPPDPVSFVSEGPPATTTSIQQPPQGEVQLPPGSHPSVEYHHSPTTFQVPSDTPQHMQTEQ